MYLAKRNFLEMACQFCPQHCDIDQHVPVKRVQIKVVACPDGSKDMARLTQRDKVFLSSAGCESTAHKHFPM